MCIRDRSLSVGETLKELGAEVAAERPVRHAFVHLLELVLAVCQGILLPLQLLRRFFIALLGLKMTMLILIILAALLSC